MKNKKEKLLNETYEYYLNLLMNDYPLDKIEELAVNDVMGYGTTIDEKIYNIEGLSELVKNQREQSEGKEIHFDINPVFRKYFSNDESAFIVDEIRVTMLIEGNKNEIPVRLSSIFEYKDEKWKLVYFHKSLAVETEKDTWHVDEWKRKNEELQKLVDEKTTDLVMKNRELEIEAAVERVRAKALAMHKSEEILGVVARLKDEVMNLNIPGVLAATIYLKEKDDSVRMWDLSSAVEMKEGIHLPLDIVFPLDETHPNFIGRRIWDNTEKYFVVMQDEADLTHTVEWLRQYKKEEAENVLRFIEANELKRVFHPTIQLTNGRLCIDLLDTPSEEIESILSKMGAAFDLAYKRFQDLQKAEAQAREAQIEGALEKIRARSNGMHKSEELSEVALLLNRELKKLGFPEKFESGFIQMEEENNIQKGWMSDFDGNNMEPFSLPLKGDHILDERYDSWKNIRPLLHQTVGGEKLQKHINFCQPTLGSGQVWEIVLKNFSDPTHFYHSYFSEGAISVIAQTPLNKEQESLLIRFTRVFEQTYTRFLDLKKAEAQAREAQIETALERVRSRSMAMHNSKELREVIAVVFEQLTLLGFTPQGCDIVIYDKKELDASYWFAGFEKGNYPRSYVIPYNEHPYYQDQINAWRKGEQYKVFIFEGELKKKYDDFLFEETDFINLPESAKRGMRSIKYVAIHDAFMSHGIIETIDLKPISEEFANILQRFAKVFDQTYTRFLDIQKAEEQAREAKIEAALESIRSKTMSMQKSEELAETASLLFKKVSEFGINTWASGFQIWNADGVSTTVWMSLPQGIMVSHRMPYTDDTFFKQILEARKRGDDFLVFESAGKSLAKTYRYMKTVPGVKEMFSDIEKAGFTLPKFQITHCAFFPLGYLMFITLEPYPEAWDLFKRFAKVFEQTYTRFLDLQNAEKQNKIIQAENERKSQELEEARQLQLAMLPKELPKLTNLDIAVYMQTATEVGGDYYDFRVGQDDTLNVALGDATGHGLKAGTLVTIIKGLFTAEAENNEVLTFFNKSSKAIKELKLGRLMMAFVFLKIKGKQLSLSNAGIPPVYIFRSEIEEVEEIDNKGMPLGAMKNFPYKETKIELNKGDVILLLSDGLPELFNEKKEMFGYDRVKETFIEVAAESSEKIIEHLKNTASDWSGGKEPDDDVTFVVLKMKQK